MNKGSRHRNTSSATTFPLSRLSRALALALAVAGSAGFAGSVVAAPAGPIQVGGGAGGSDVLSNGGAGGISGGGGGGGNPSAYPPLPGGDGGAGALPDQPAQAGQNGPDAPSSPYVGGTGGAADGANPSAGGGGGGGAAYYDDSISFGSNGGNGGAGGAGAVYSTDVSLSHDAAGTAGGDASGLTAGGGGGGGGGLVLTGTNASLLTNGYGISGGNGGSSNYGGGGGAGVVLMNSGTIAATAGTVIKGGNGGTGNPSPGQGGAGVFLYQGGQLNNAGTVAGGNGAGTNVGSDGNAAVLMNGGGIDNSGQLQGGAGGNSTSGGNGAAAVRAYGGAIVNGASGTITGGAGGDADSYHPSGYGGTGIEFLGGAAGTLTNNGGSITGGNGGSTAYPTHGAGGVGVLVDGDNVTVINAGSIAGGESDDPTPIRANALQFQGTGSRLELRAGYSFTGNVVAAQAGNTLALGGADNAAFNVSNIVASASPGATDEYVGFSNFEKTGAGTWTLLSATSAATPWTLSEGTLAIGEDASLGAVSGGLIFNGGTLETTSGFATSRAITLAGAGTIQADADSTPLTLDGLISGPGSLTFTGAGAVVLNHANTYQGGTNLYNGDVDVSVTGALGTGPVVVDGTNASSLPTILTFGHAARADNLSITNRNNGQTVFEGTAAAGNAAILNAAQGRTIFADAASAGTATIINQGQGATMFADHSSAGSASITNQANGVLALLDAATAEGARVVNQAGGIVDISQTVTGTSIGSLSGAGGVGLGGKVLTLGALNQNDTISGTIVDGNLLGLLTGSATGGSLVKVGSGTLTLNGANTYTGGTTVQAGTLAVGDADHSSASVLGDVQVDAGGTLRGHGSIAGNVDSTGTVWPGGSIGTLTIGGNYTQSPSGTLQMEVSPTAASQLKVGGTASLAGTLSLLYAPGTYTTKTYTLVSAGSVNGTFSTVTGNAPAGVTQGVTYASNAVDLNLTGSGSVQPVVVAPTQATIFGAVGSSALRAGQSTNEVLLDRLVGPCGVAAASASTHVAAAGGQSSSAASAGAGASSQTSAAGASGSAVQSLSCARQGNGLWIQAQGTDTRIDGNNGAPDTRDRRYGFLTGVDHQWKGMTVGVAGGYSHADVTESGNGSKGTLDTLRIAAYGAKNLGAYTLAGTLGYAYDFSSTTRSFGALGSAKGDGHGQEFTAGLQASRPWSLGPVVLTPRVGVRYAYLDGLSTNETGPTAQNLGVGNQHLQSLQPYVGVTLDYPFTLHDSDRPASIQLRAGYAYETQSTGRDVSVTAADGTGFVIAGTRDTRGLVTAGLGATLPIGKSASAYVRYDSVLHTGNVNAQSLQAGVDYRF